MSKFLLVVLFVFMNASCSNKQLYNAGRDYQKSECMNKSESEKQYNECLNISNQSYEEYEKERKKIVH